MVPASAARLPLSPSTPPSAALRTAAAAGLFLLGLCALSPSVDFGDAGELAAASSTLSLPHPSSYPLYCLAAKAWGSLVPLGSWTFRCNLFSLACALAAFLLLAACARRLGFGEGSALLGAALFWLLPEASRAALGTEVFALHLVWAALGAWLVLALPEPAEPPGLALLGLWLGLGLGNHHTLLLCAPPLFWLLWKRSGWPGARAWTLGLAGFALGLALYLYLPLRSAHYPPMDWGHPTSVRGVLKTFLRQDYGSASLTVEGALPRTADALFQQVRRFAVFSWAQAGWAGAALALWGAWSWAGPVPLAFPLAWLLLAGPVFFCLGNPPFTPELDGALGRFFLLSWLPLAWLWASGLDALGSKLGRGALAVGLVPALVLMQGRPLSAERWSLGPYDYGRSLQDLPPDAALFLDGGDDNFYAFAERQLAQGRRLDVEVHDRGGLVFPSPYGADFRSLSKDEKEARRRSTEAAYAASKPLYYATLNPEVLPGRSLLPAGLVQPSVSAERKLRASDLAWPDEALRFEPALMAASYRYRALAPVSPFIRGWSLAELGRYDEALRYWSQARAWGPDAKWLSTNLPGLIEGYGYKAGLKEDWDACARLYRFRLSGFTAGGQPWANYAGCLERSGRLGDAAEASVKAVEAQPKLAQAHANLGAVRWRQGRWADAAMAFERASQLKPEDEGYRKYAREARAKAGKP